MMKLIIFALVSVIFSTTAFAKKPLTCWYDAAGKSAGADTGSHGVLESQFGKLVVSPEKHAVYSLVLAQWDNGNDCPRLVNISQAIKTETASSQPTDTRPPEFIKYLSYFKPIAQYPLSSDANDSSGNSPAMNLKGMVFKDGALYSDGVYTENTASAYPKNWDLNTFTVSARFYVNVKDENRPVFITGNRWLGFYLNKNGTVSMKYNNSNFMHSNVRFSVGTLHEATIAYQGGIAYFYLDGIHAGNKEIKFDFVNATPSIGITDYSNGATFKGWIQDLTVSTLK